MVVEVLIGITAFIIACGVAMITVIACRSQKTEHPHSSSTSYSFQTNERLHVVNNISYDTAHSVRLTNTNCRLYKGRFQGQTEVVVKKIEVPRTEMKKINTELHGLETRLKRTVEINHKLAHGNSGKNIVKFFCHDFEKEQNKTFLLFALENCECNLEEFITSRNQYPPVPSNTIIKQLLCGLHYLHARQIVHRDLKPSNVLIKKEQNDEIIFKLSDFGLSKLNSQSMNGSPSDRVFQSDEYGTMGWIPPEIYELREKLVQNPDRSYWKRSDIFALGLLFYHVASDGHYVFQNQDAIKNNTSDFSHVVGNIPLLQLLMHMLAPNHKDRPYTEDIFNHPALWDILKQLDFFETTCNLMTDQALLTSCQIEQNAANVLGSTWRQPLTAEIEKLLFPTARNRQNRHGGAPVYDKTSVQSLIRAIRNNKGHYFQLYSTVQSEFGGYPGGYLRYWTDKFPQLLMHTYNAMKVHLTHPSLQGFY